MKRQILAVSWLYVTLVQWLQKPSLIPPFSSETVESENRSLKQLLKTMKNRGFIVVIYDDFFEGFLYAALRA